LWGITGKNARAIIVRLCLLPGAKKHFILFAPLRSAKNVVFASLSLPSEDLM
jgi:hypothetical protein